jgi:hypothetical protein
MAGRTISVAFLYSLAVALLVRDYTGPPTHKIPIARFSLAAPPQNIQRQFVGWAKGPDANASGGVPTIQPWIGIKLVGTAQVRRAHATTEAARREKIIAALPYYSQRNSAHRPTYIAARPLPGQPWQTGHI